MKTATWHLWWLCCTCIVPAQACARDIMAAGGLGPMCPTTGLEHHLPRIGSSLCSAAALMGQFLDSLQKNFHTNPARHLSPEETLIVKRVSIRQHTVETQVHEADWTARDSLYLHAACAHTYSDKFMKVTDVWLHVNCSDCAQAKVGTVAVNCTPRIQPQPIPQEQWQQSSNTIL